MRLKSEVFPSGMRMVLREAPAVAQLTMYVSYRAGATDEPAGKEGLAELAARLTGMARHGGPGTPTLEERQRAVQVTPNSVVTYDDTELWTTMAPGSFAGAAALEAQRLAAPLAHVTEEDFRRVRARQIDELWVRQEAVDKGAPQRWLHEKLLTGHVYGRPMGGTPESLDRLTLEDVRAFVEANYTPAHAVLVVSGPLPLADAKFEAARAFAGLLGAGTGVSHAPVQRTPPPALEDTAERTSLAVVHASVKTPQLYFLLPLPGRYSGKFAENQVVLEAMQKWMQENIRNSEYPLSNTSTTFYQELDGLTVVSCWVAVKKKDLTEEEARKMSMHMLETLEKAGGQLTRSLVDEGFGPSMDMQQKHGMPITYKRASPMGLRWRLEQQLRSEATSASPIGLARTMRATGRVDVLRLREEQLAQALTYDVLSPYLRQYLRTERVRTMLVLP